MSSKVGPNGQVVIEKAFREQLGVEPGWLAVQRLVDDHIEIYFVPPEHDRSLAGSLAPASGVTISPEDWHEARERAWEAHVRERFGPNPDAES